MGVKIDDRVVCVLELDHELRRLEALCDEALCKVDGMEAERQKLLMRLERYGRHWPTDRKLIVEKQVAWLQEQMRAARSRSGG